MKARYLVKLMGGTIFIIIAVVVFNANAFADEKADRQKRGRIQASNP